MHCSTFNNPVILLTSRQTTEDRAITPHKLLGIPATREISQFRLRRYVRSPLRWKYKQKNGGDDHVR